MIIVSQDKDTHVSYERSAINVDNDFSICAYFNGKYYFLGQYSSEEKALKIMDMISECYRSYCKIEGGLLATSNHYIQPQSYVLPKMYKMPLDEEVKV